MNPCFNVSNKRRSRGTPEPAVYKDVEGWEFCSPAESNKNDRGGTDVYESESSDCASAVSAMTPMSTSELTLRYENLSFSSNSSVLHNSTHVNEVVGGKIEPVGKQIYQPTVYGYQRQKQTSLFFNSAQMIGYPPSYHKPLSVDELHMNLHQPEQSQQPQITYPLNKQEYIESTQNGTFTLQNKQESPRTNSCSDSLTPSFVSLDPFYDSMESPELPPEFHLHKNPVAIPLPDRMSCNICPRPDKLLMPKITDMPSSVPNASEKSLIQRPQANSVSVTQKHVVEKTVLRGVDGGKMGWEMSYYSPYQHNCVSSLLITWSGSTAKLAEKLSHCIMDARLVFKRTGEKSRLVFKRTGEKFSDVVFKNHFTGRKAFKMQRDIRLRILPPWNRPRNCLRNPGTMFLAKLDTKAGLAIEKEREECHDIMGKLLMSDRQTKNGDMIWADKLIGHLIDAIYCKTKFMHPECRIVQMKKSRVLISVDVQTSL